jgi:hypothetical protein
MRRRNIHDDRRKRLIRTVGRVEVVLVHWPREAERRDDLARERIPRLLLVAAQASPPFVTDQLEDWVRIPADEQELFLRMERLSSFATPERAWPLALSVIESRLLERLQQDLGRIVDRAALSKAAWDGEPPGDRALDSALARLRVKLRDTAYNVVALRGRGFVLAERDGADG